MNAKRLAVIFDRCTAEKHSFGRRPRGHAKCSYCGAWRCKPHLKFWNYQYVCYPACKTFKDVIKTEFGKAIL